MEKITAYRVVSNSWSSELSKTVNEMIAEGWQPYGSLTVMDNVFHQTMVKVQSEVDHG